MVCCFQRTLPQNNRSAPGQRGEDLGDVPVLGAHTDVILAEIGWSEADIAALRERGAV